MDTRPPPTQLVVVGSSAGGIEALSTLMATIPADFPAPIVIAQHLDPLRPSHLAERIPTKELRAIIDAALAGEYPPPSGDTLPVITEMGEQRYIQVVGYPHRLEGDADEGPVASVPLLITDVTEQTRIQVAQEQKLKQEALTAIPATKQESDATLKQLREENARLTVQTQQLVTVNRELRNANHDLTATNIELRQASEEYLINTEEVQAAEEVETLNEELQATNEELETLNEELQATVEELNATNDDLEARSDELLEMARRAEELRKVSEAERGQLATILVGMGDAVLVVDTEGQAIRTNETYTRMLGDPNETLAAEGEDGRPLPEEAQMKPRLAHGESFTLVFTLAAGDDRRWYEAIGQPLSGSEPGGSERKLGGVAVIRDITDRSMRRLQQDFLSLASHEMRTPLTAPQLALQIVLKRLAACLTNPKRCQSVPIMG